MSDIFNTTYSTPALVTYCIWLGVSIASVMMYYEKRIIGGFVRALIKAKAVSPESAKTPGELKLRMNGFIARSLKNPNSSLRHTVVCVGEEPKEGKYPEKKRLKKIGEARFYIPENRVFSAEERYNRRNTTLPLVIITIIVTFILAAAIVKYTPKIIGLFNNAFETFGK